MTEPRPTTEAELIEQIRAIDVAAPEALHRQVESMIADMPQRRRASRRAGGSHSLAPRLAAGGAFAAVLVALAIAISLNGSSATLSVHDASAITLRHATTGPPADSPSDGRRLTAAVDGVAFPYWSRHFGWHATGTRSDTVDGRALTTVFYENARHQRVGYAIAAGTGATQASGGVVSTRDGTPYRLLTVDGVAVISWMRKGHLCVISGRGVQGATLLRLASWDDRPVAS